MSIPPYPGERMDPCHQSLLTCDGCVLLSPVASCRLPKGVAEHGLSYEITSLQQNGERTMLHPMTRLDEYIAYQVVLSSLPQRALWTRTVATHSHGGDVGRVFQSIRREVLARLGDLSAGRSVANDWPLCNEEAVAPEARLDAFRLVLDLIPRDRVYGLNMRARHQGCHPERVYLALNNIRRMLQARIQYPVEPEFLHPACSVSEIYRD